MFTELGNSANRTKSYTDAFNADNDFPCSEHNKQHRRETFHINFNFRTRSPSTCASRKSRAVHALLCSCVLQSSRVYTISTCTRRIAFTAEQLDLKCVCTFSRAPSHMQMRVPLWCLCRAYSSSYTICCTCWTRHASENVLRNFFLTK